MVTWWENCFRLDNGVVGGCHGEERDNLKPLLLPGVLESMVPWIISILIIIIKVIKNKSSCPLNIKTPFIS